MLCKRSVSAVIACFIASYVAGCSGECAVYDATWRDDAPLVQRHVASNPRAIFCRRSRGLTPLHVARAKTAAVLIKAGHAVNVADDYGVTPLHVAAARADIEVVSLLIANGAEVNARNRHGQTPLHWAAQLNSGDDIDRYRMKDPEDLYKQIYLSAGSPDVVIEALLAAGADPQIRDHGGNTANDLR